MCLWFVVLDADAGLEIEIEMTIRTMYGAHRYSRYQEAYIHPVHMLDA